jgi:hypothetical protein
MAKAGKSHKKATKGAKAAKQAAAAKKKRKTENASAAAAGGGASGGPAKPRYNPDPAAAKARNPKAFTVQSRGRAKLQRARSAEKEQRRMHGAFFF